MYEEGVHTDRFFVYSFHTRIEGTPWSGEWTKHWEAQALPERTDISVTARKAHFKENPF